MWLEKKKTKVMHYVSKYVRDIFAALTMLQFVLFVNVFIKHASTKQYFLL